MLPSGRRCVRTSKSNITSTTRRLGNDRRRRRLRGGRRRRQHKGQPYVPAVGSVGGIELAIALKIDVALHACHRKNISNLRADADDAGLERAEDRRAPVVTGQLFVDIADKADLQLRSKTVTRSNQDGNRCRWYIRSSYFRNCR